MTDEWCQAHQTRALENFDLNAGYIASLDHAEFNAALQQSVAKQRGMKEVADFNQWPSETESDSKVPNLSVQRGSG